MFKYGLKLWSTNNDYVTAAQKLFEGGVYDYIELYAVPGSYARYIDLWRGLRIPYVVHAPHWRNGLNLADRAKVESNLVMARETLKYADRLGAGRIIFHPGIAGDINETARQIKSFRDDRVIIENKPCYALDDGLLCNGSSPAEIGSVMVEAGIGFCLDIGHAIVSANGHNQDSRRYLEEFMTLKPVMYHLADGDAEGIYDKHEHIGRGNYNLKYVLSLLPTTAAITIETVKDSQDNLDDYLNDIAAVKSYERN